MHAACGAALLHDLVCAHGDLKLDAACLQSLSLTCMLRARQAAAAVARGILTAGHGEAAASITALPTNAWWCSATFTGHVFAERSRSACAAPPHEDHRLTGHLRIQTCARAMLLSGESATHDRQAPVERRTALVRISGDTHLRCLASLAAVPRPRACVLLLAAQVETPLRLSSLTWMAQYKYTCVNVAGTDGQARRRVCLAPEVGAEPQAPPQSGPACVTFRSVPHVTAFTGGTAASALSTQVRQRYIRQRMPRVLHAMSCMQACYWYQP